MAAPIARPGRILRGGVVPAHKPAYPPAGGRVAPKPTLTHNPVPRAVPQGHRPIGDLTHNPPWRGKG